MFRKSLFALGAISFAFVNCQHKESAGDEKSVDQVAVVEDTSTVNADTSSQKYLANTSDIAVASRIQKILPELLKKELVGTDSSARKFVYYQVDLNDDGQSELLIGFTGMNWCGSGGCTALLLSAQGNLITRFTVADFPFTILDRKTKGWKDLVTYSGGSDRLLQWDGNTYPKNPSVAPKFKGELGSNSQRALEFSERQYPWFTF